MVWSTFTKQNFKLFNKYKYSLNKNNILLNYIKNERINIVNIIRNKKL